MDVNGPNGDMLFVPEPDKKAGIWDGRLLTLEQLKSKYDVDKADIAPNFITFLQSLVGSMGLTHILMESNDDVEHFNELEGAATLGVEIDAENLLSIIQPCRDVKSEKEIALQRYAANVSAQAHVELMKFCRPGVYEFQLESKFVHYCSMHGLRQQGYPSIVGSGYNSAVLHYSKNSKIVADGDLVLVDAGGEFLNYTADITRTFPANGKFNEKQRLIYGKVLAIQKELIGMIKPGVLFSDIIARCGELICLAAIELGFVNGNVADVPAMVLARVQYSFMPHGLGHFLGQDVHDTSIYPKVALEPGNVVTIEPGFYFNESALQSAMEDEDKRPWINMEAVQPWIDSNFGGVRIEDDVLVTADGNEVLSALCPKEIDDIEKIMAR